MLIDTTVGTVCTMKNAEKTPMRGKDNQTFGVYSRDLIRSIEESIMVGDGSRHRDGSMFARILNPVPLAALTIHISVS